MTKQSLREIIAEQQARLTMDIGTERAALEVIQNFSKLPQAVIVAGIRRCGKSTLLSQIMAQMQGDYYYFNFEDERLVDFKAEQCNDLYEVLIELYGKKKIFFFDEIQNVPNWERFVRRLQDNNNKFFITGSNASLLSRELGTRLTGRYVDCTLYPFSFAEFLRFKGYKYTAGDWLQTDRRANIKQYFNEYFVMGGMPEYLRFGSDEALKKVYESIIYRDIITRYNLNDERALRELCVYLFSNLTTPFSYTTLKETLRLGSMNTVKSYIQYLENSFLFFTVNKFNFSYRKQILSPKKIYCIDNALAKVMGFSFSSNQGRFLENMVFLELKRRGHEPMYYLTAKGREIDFILHQNKKIQALIQVCWSLENVSTRKRELDALIEAMDECGLSVGYILTDNKEEELLVGTKKIIVMPVYKWLLVNLPK